MNINNFSALHYCNKENIKPQYTLVESLLQACSIVRDILLKETILAIDCEGIVLSKEGRLTLIQIGLADQRVFVFDILKGGSLMFLGLDHDRPGLKSVLENKRILKLLHDCRNDWDSLLHQYSVRLFGFIDTQEAYSVYDLFINQSIALPISLMSFIKIFCNESMDKKQQMKLQMKEDHTIWGKRPINQDMMTYACEDVLYLIKAWEKLTMGLNDYLIEIIKVLSIFKVVDSKMFNEFSEYLTMMIMENYRLVNQGRMTFEGIGEIDYVYGFLKMKNEERVYGDDGGSIIVQKGYDYKKKQRVTCFQEMINQYKMMRKQIGINMTMNISNDIHKTVLLQPCNMNWSSSSSSSRYNVSNINNNNYYDYNNTQGRKTVKKNSIYSFEKNRDRNHNNKNNERLCLRNKTKNIVYSTKHNKKNKRKRYLYMNNNHSLIISELSTNSSYLPNNILKSPNNSRSLLFQSKTTLNLPIIFKSNSTAITNSNSNLNKSSQLSLSLQHHRSKSFSYFPSLSFSSFPSLNLPS